MMIDELISNDWKWSCWSYFFIIFGRWCHFLGFDIIRVFHWFLLEIISWTREREKMRREKDWRRSYFDDWHSNVMIVDWFHHEVMDLVMYVEIMNVHYHFAFHYSIIDHWYWYLNSFSYDLIWLFANLHPDKSLFKFRFLQIVFSHLDITWFDSINCRLNIIITFMKDKSNGIRIDIPTYFLNLNRDQSVENLLDWSYTGYLFL